MASNRSSGSASPRLSPPGSLPPLDRKNFPSVLLGTLGFQKGTRVIGSPKTTVGGAPDPRLLLQQAWLLIRALHTLGLHESFYLEKEFCGLQSKSLILNNAAVHGPSPWAWLRRLARWPLMPPPASLCSSLERLTPAPATLEQSFFKESYIRLSRSPWSCLSLCLECLSPLVHLI